MPAHSVWAVHTESWPIAPSLVLSRKVLVTKLRERDGDRSTLITLPTFGLAVSCPSTTAVAVENAAFRVSLTKLKCRSRKWSCTSELKLLSGTQFRK